MEASSYGSKVQLLYSKSKVYVHSSASAKDNIPGFIALVRPPAAKNEEILVSWIPEQSLAGADYDSYVKVDLNPDTTSTSMSEVLVSKPPASSISSYAFSVPLFEIYSISFRPPSLGWWHGSIIIYTKSEDALPALFFHDSESKSTANEQRERSRSFDTFDQVDTGGRIFWGGEDFYRQLSKYCKVVRSTLEPQLFLINPDPTDIQAFSPKVKVDADTQDPFVKMFKDARWSLLEKLAHVTHLSKKAAKTVYDSSPAPVRNLLNKPEVQKIGDEFDSARVYLAKWAMSIAEESERNRKRVILDPYSSESIGSLVGDFEVLDLQHQVTRRNPVSVEEWNGFFDHTGRLSISVTEVKERIFHGGLDPEVRQEAWPFLLEVYGWGTSHQERQAIKASQREEYYRLKRVWWDAYIRQDTSEFWRDQKNRIEKDVHRTDRSLPLFENEDSPHPDPQSSFTGTNADMEQMKSMLITYNEYNKNLGYVQGMSDLLSPLYVVFQDDSMAFWAFVGFMKRMQRNFLRDQSGMKQQLLTLDQLVALMEPELYDHLARADSTNLFFFFRMLLVWFKREFKWDDVLRLWEVLWTDYLSGEFHLFVAFAVLDKHKRIIMQNLRQFDEILRYMNDLSMNIDLEETLHHAEVLFYKFKATVETVDLKRKGATTPAQLSRLPEITPELRQLLSKQYVISEEQERPPGASGG